jgi:hypothetical protein
MLNRQRAMGSKDRKVGEWQEMGGGMQPGLQRQYHQVFPNDNVPFKSTSDRTNPDLVR